MAFGKPVEQKKGNKRNYKAQRKRWEKFEKPTTTGKANKVIYK
jgi:hypothetical protein